MRVFYLTNYTLITIMATVFVIKIIILLILTLIFTFEQIQIRVCLYHAVGVYPHFQHLLGYILMNRILRGGKPPGRLLPTLSLETVTCGEYGVYVNCGL